MASEFLLSLRRIMRCRPSGKLGQGVCLKMFSAGFRGAIRPTQKIYANRNRKAGSGVGMESSPLKEPSGLKIDRWIRAGWPPSPPRTCLAAQRPRTVRLQASSAWLPPFWLLKERSAMAFTLGVW